MSVFCESLFFGRPVTNNCSRAKHLRRNLGRQLTFTEIFSLVRVATHRHGSSHAGSKLRERSKDRGIVPWQSIYIAGCMN